MCKRSVRCLAVALSLSVVCIVAAWAQESVLKTRMTVPKGSDIDQSVSLQALVAQSGKNDWSSMKAATLQGYVRQVEKDDDGDVVIFLAGKADDTDTKNWVVAEVPPGWQGKNQDLTEKSLRGLLLKHVKVTGWLFYDSNPGEDPSRGTPWEIHPVTSITRLQ